MRRDSPVLPYPCGRSHGTSRLRVEEPADKATVAVSHIKYPANNQEIWVCMCKLPDRWTIHVREDLKLWSRGLSELVLHEPPSLQSIPS